MPSGWRDRRCATGRGNVAPDRNVFFFPMEHLSRPFVDAHPYPTARTTRSHRPPKPLWWAIDLALRHRVPPLEPFDAIAERRRSSASRAWSFRIRASTGGRSPPGAGRCPPPARHLETERTERSTACPPALQFVPSPTVTARRASQPVRSAGSRDLDRASAARGTRLAPPVAPGSDAAGGRPRLAPGSRTRRRGGRAACRRAAARRPPAPRRASTTGFRACDLPIFDPDRGLRPAWKQNLAPRRRLDDASDRGVA